MKLHTIVFLLMICLCGLAGCGLKAPPKPPPAPPPSVADSE